MEPVVRQHYSPKTANLALTTPAQQPRSRNPVKQADIRDRQLTHARHPGRTCSTLFTTPQKPIGGSRLIAAANSDGKKAVVDLYGISSQPGGTADAKVNVDEVTFKGCTTNFKVSGGGNGSIEFPNFGS